jgi:hypothetical protein
MDFMNVIEKADREIAKGKLWRAKEILQGAIGHAGYETEIYEKLGLVLLRMQDLAEAGKYLFLSGARKPEYLEPIEIFIGRYQKKPHNLYNQFPRSARLAKIEDYPPAVADALRALNFPEILRNDAGYAAADRGGEEGFFGLAVLLAVVVAILVLLVLGLIKLLEIVFRILT